LRTIVTTTLTLAGTVSEFDASAFRISFAAYIGADDANAISLTVEAASVLVTARAVMTDDAAASSALTALAASTAELTAQLGVVVVAASVPIFTSETLFPPSPPPPSPPPPATPPPDFDAFGGFDAESGLAGGSLPHRTGMDETGWLLIIICGALMLALLVLCSYCKKRRRGTSQRRRNSAGGASAIPMVTLTTMPLGAGASSTCAGSFAAPHLLQPVEALASEKAASTSYRAWGRGSRRAPTAPTASTSSTVSITRHSTDPHGIDEASTSSSAVPHAAQHHGENKDARPLDAAPVRFGPSAPQGAAAAEGVIFVEGMDNTSGTLHI
jgi:hypothetical protein